MRALTSVLIFFSITGSGIGEEGSKATDVRAVTSNSALRRMSTSSVRAVMRLGYDDPGDSPVMLYAASTSACSLNFGEGDGGWQVPSADGKCWIGSFSGRFDVRIWGAKGKCFNSTCTIDDSPAIKNALSACYALGGGQVWFPPTSAMYRIGTAIGVGGNGCSIQGSGQPNWPGPDGSQAMWGSSGSWITCEDPSSVSNCFSFGGSAVVDGINFWEQQPTPAVAPGTPWTPLDRSFIIKFTQQFSRASNIQFANVSNGIIFDFPERANIAGSYSSFDHIWGAGFRTSVSFHSVNDTMHCSDIHERNLWHIENPNVVDWMEKRSVGWEIKYLDNLQCTDIEFYKQSIAMKFSDASAVYGKEIITHSAENLQFSNSLFNQVVQAVDLTSGRTVVSMNFVNTVAQTDTDTGRAAAYLFNLASDHVDVSFSNLQIGAVGNGVLALGNGEGGRVRVTGLNIQSPYPTSTISGYGYLGYGSPAFTLARGSTLDIAGGVQNVVKGSVHAGPLVACAQMVNPVSPRNCGKVLSTIEANAP